MLLAIIVVPRFIFFRFFCKYNYILSLYYMHILYICIHMYLFHYLSNYQSNAPCTTSRLSLSETCNCNSISSQCPHHLHIHLCFEGFSQKRKCVIMTTPYGYTSLSQTTCLHFKYNANIVEVLAIHRHMKTK